MAPVSESPEKQATPLSYFVEGMDCPNCLRTVEGAVGKLPGVAAVSANFSSQSLRLELDESLTPRLELERLLTQLGYSPNLHAASPPDTLSDTPQGAASPLAWTRWGQGKLVLVSGALLAAATLLSLFAAPYAQFGFIAATLLGAAPLARKAYYSMLAGNPFSINTLVTLAALGALVIGEAPEGALVVFLFAVGELLEGIAAGRARAGIKALAALAPKTALLQEATGVREVSADSLKPGQLVQVNPGARVPADGVIVAGRGSLDDSPVTGESAGVYKTEGDSVFAGSINLESVLSVRVSKEAADNTIARIIHLVEEAEASKAPTARFIDRFSRRYTPFVVLIATLSATLPALLFAQPWHPWLYKGLALLLIGCPCALVLSVPATLTSAISAGARRGLLVKGGAVLEAIGNAKTIAFDKTGTLTAGKPRVTDVSGNEQDDVLRLAAAVESGSSHPLAVAIVQEARARQLAVPAAKGARALAGRGVAATVEGRSLALSSPQHAAATVRLSASQKQEIMGLEASGKTVVVLQQAETFLGVIALRDEPREDAQEALVTLRRLGVHPLLLTGDNARTANTVAQTLGVDVKAELLPEDKLAQIASLRRAGPVVMVGDGINDAPALAEADVGVAMGSGTDVAIETADAVLLQARVSGVAELVQLSRASLHNIKQNIAIALGLKAFFLCTTLLGVTNLWMAVLADTGATALVTANALRLLGWRAPTDKSPAANAR